MVRTVKLITENVHKRKPDFVTSVRCETQFQQQCKSEKQEECWQETEEECSQQKECVDVPVSSPSSGHSSGGSKHKRSVEEEEDIPEEQLRAALDEIPASALLDELTEEPYDAEARTDETGVAAAASREKRGLGGLLLKKLAKKALPLAAVGGLAAGPAGALALPAIGLPLAAAPALHLAGKGLGLKAGLLKAQQLSSSDSPKGGSSSGSGHSSGSSGHSSGGHSSPKPQQKCSVVTTCRDVPVRKCRTWDEPICAQVPVEKCWDEPIKKCWDEPQQKCTSVPQQTCWEVRLSFLVP